MEKKYKKGEVVWAKVRGFPWWPGVVRNILKVSKFDENEGSVVQETKVEVCFVGDSTYAHLASNKIDKFETKFEEFSRTKKKKLLYSIKLAKKIISGELPFEKHLNYEKRKTLTSSMDNDRRQQNEESMNDGPSEKPKEKNRDDNKAEKKNLDISSDEESWDTPNMLGKFQT